MSGHYHSEPYVNLPRLLDVYGAVSRRESGETDPETGELDKDGPPILGAWSNPLKAEMKTEGGKQQPSGTEIHSQSWLAKAKVGVEKELVLLMLT
ncbi:hypothetical protein STEG23_021881 [Scotinomys teguina]